MLDWPNSRLALATGAYSRGPVGTINHRRAGHLRDVERNYFHILDHGPRDAGVLIPLGLVTVQLRDPIAAIEPVSRAMALNGDTPNYHFNRDLAPRGPGSSNCNRGRASGPKADCGDALTHLSSHVLSAGATSEAKG